MNSRIRVFKLLKRDKPAQAAFLIDSEQAD